MRLVLRWSVVRKENKLWKKQEYLFHLKKAGEEIINDFKSILNADVIAHISFEVYETEKESMSGHKFTDYEVVIKRKEK